MSDKGEQIAEAVSGMLPKKIVPTFIVAGFTVTCLFTFCWVLAAVIDGRWVFGTNALSDLGVGMSEAARIIFNYGCVLTGVAGCIFGYGLMMHERGWLAVTGVVTMIGCIFLMGVGAVPESYQWPHMVCAGTFAGMSLIAMLTSGIGDYKKGRKKYAIFEIVLAIACVALAVIPGLFGYFEPLAIAGVLIWVFVQSYKYYTIIGVVDYVDPLGRFFEEDNKRTKYSVDEKKDKE